ncbi:hypothetical protein CBI30_09520 [Polynucleobacter aenigmaticus]|uniref:WavE lipopolysaccharide synthesis n=1 Tax=Polynucleobacter aenigmaticus TaxID=1743164 RepID=A0A254PV12_9BURK|nr:WavE lipopolysaccharide synthesis family protein [Polynucleobacter aenigmaticus]OWS70383.1 hypothetical protein CBI30_09520 [Polynucleobacter aenigmaticus]
MLPSSKGNGIAMKVGCIIQGDIRRGSNLILEMLPRLFDYTVLSTWDDGWEAPKGSFELIRSPKPEVPGFTNRNYQRFSTARGLGAAKAAGCDYVLKWRTDMLPTSMGIKQLLDWAQFSPPRGTQSRIVVPAFRNISITPDAFSSMPDLFSFGHIEEMEKLWDDDSFDYTQNYNMSAYDRDALGSQYLNSPALADLYCAEAELYALYRSRLTETCHQALSHNLVAANYLRLIDHRRLGILWFGAQSGFRSIGQAWEHPWWTEKNWRQYNARIYSCGYKTSGPLSKLKKKISKYKIQNELKCQEKIWLDSFPNVKL